jgi:predicted lysophospholipase L1 biosynthesis ABC-type transport system permease subunit
MSITHLNWHPTARQTRWFGVICLGAGFALPALLGTAGWLLVVGGLLGMMGLTSIVSHTAGRLCYRALAVTTWPLGFAVGSALLVGLYLLILTPIGLARRAWGADVLHRRIERDRVTYWHERVTARPAETYHRQS